MGGGAAVPAVSFLFPGAVVLRGHHADRGGELRGRHRDAGTAGAAVVSPAGYELRFLPFRCVRHLSLVGHCDWLHRLHRHCECL